MTVAGRDGTLPRWPATPDATMTLDELAMRLELVREHAPHKELTTRTQIFAIEYAPELRHLSMRDLGYLMTLAGVPQSMATEVRKCVKLADYVTVEQAYRTRPLFET